MAVAGGLLLAGCAAAQQPYENQSALSPDERELQALQNQLGIVNRRLDAIASAEQSGELESEVRTLRGQLENLKHEVDQNQKQITSVLQDINSRLQQLEQSAATSPASPNPAVPSAKFSSKAPTPASPSSSAPSPASPSSTGNKIQAPPGEATSVTGGALPSLKNRPIGKQHASARTRGLAQEVAYIHAFNYLQAGKLDKAVSGFQAFLKQYPNGEYSDNALYWLGSAYYVENDARHALSSLESLLRKFPNSPKVPDAMVKMGIIYQNEHKISQARAEFNRVLAEYPNSNAASVAKQRLGAMPH